MLSNLKRWLLPLTVAGLALYLASRPANPVTVERLETPSGKNAQGYAYDCHSNREVVRFCVYSTLERL